MKHEFADMIKLLGPLIPNYELIWADRKKGEILHRGYGRAKAEMLLERIFPRLRSELSRSWNLAMVVFEQFYADAVGEPFSAAPSAFTSAVDAASAVAVAEGRPILRHRLKAPRRSMVPEDTKPFDSLCADPLTLICSMLHVEAARHVAAIGKEVHLHRDPDKGGALYSPSSADWYEFQVEAGSAAMFSPLPHARKDRLRGEIALIKTLWDISSSLRARRFEEILDGISTRKLSGAMDMLEDVISDATVKKKADQ
jgi:hypothetical protein